MKVLAHPDPFVLERELLAGLAAAQEADPLAHLLVLVPTRGLADHLQRRIGNEREAWLNLEVLHFHGAALRILEAAGESAPRLLSPRLQEAILRKALQAPELESDSWRRFVELRPGALRMLLATITDLREAGIAAEELASAVGGRRRERELAGLYRRYLGDLEELKRRLNLTDRSGLLEQAVEHAAHFAGSCRAIWLYGAYELIGTHLELLRALDGETEVAVLLPASHRENAPASAYARRFAGSYLLGEDEPLSACSGEQGGLLGANLAALYDELAAPTPLEKGQVTFRNFQGGMSEVEWAVRCALKAASQEVLPAEIGIVARSLHQYAPLLESCFAEAGIPWSSSFKTPLRREPVIHDLLVMLRIIGEGFPRAATAELLSSAFIRWDRLLPNGNPPAGDLAESWSRRAGILGGLEEWTSTLVEWADEESPSEERSEEEQERADRRAAWMRGQAEGIARAVKALAAGYGSRKPCSWSTHADRVERIVRDILPGRGDESESDPAVASLFELLDDMRRLDAITNESGEQPHHAALEWLEGAVDETGLPKPGEENGGIRVLDAMQARGLTFRRIFLLGFHSGLFPRIPREDPFLGDDSRQRLRQATGKPLPVKDEGEQEERLLLSMMLGAAHERIDLSWQRADDAGRALTPSLALREVARVVLGKPDYRGLVKELTARTAADPLLRLESTLSGSGMLSGGEERLLLALRGDGPESVAPGLIERLPALEPGLRMLIATESFSTRNPEYDGRIGAAAPRPDPLSASALGSLGGCPLQFFFERVLHLRPLEEEISAFDLLPSEIGLAVHAILEKIYRALRDEGLLGGGDAAAARERAAELLEPLWNEQTAAMARRIGGGFGTLWRVHERGWLEAIRLFLDEDIPRISELAPDTVELESHVLSTLDLGEGVLLKAIGRFDRLLRCSESLLVSDYKTSGDLERQTNVTRMLKGLSMQVPLYNLLAGAGAGVELLGVGPSYDRDGEGRQASSSFEAVEGRERDGLLETMRVLVSLADNGLYPMNPPHPCRWCSYAPACRRNHAPTQQRELQAWETADFRDLAGKNRKKLPRLADIRAKRERKKEAGQ